MAPVDQDEDMQMTRSSQSGPSAKSWASQDDWKNHRAEIRHLYIDDNQTLDYVMKYMETYYGMKAT